MIKVILINFLQRCINKKSLCLQIYHLNFFVWYLEKNFKLKYTMYYQKTKINFIKCIFFTQIINNRFINFFQFLEFQFK